MIKILLGISLLSSISASAYDDNGCETIKDLIYKCTEITSSLGQNSDISKAEICIGKGGVSEELHVTSENFSSNRLNWHRRNVTTLKKNTKNKIVFEDSDTSLSGCFFNPGSSCYSKELVTFDKISKEVEFSIKFSTSKVFIGGWTTDVLLKMKCEEI